MESKNHNTWTRLDGVQIPFNKLSHEHISNILWYKEIILNSDRYNDNAYFLLSVELHKRFNGVRLPYKPIYDFEIEFLNKNRMVDDMGNIYYKGDIIGSINSLSRKIEQIIYEHTKRIEWWLSGTIHCIPAKMFVNIPTETIVKFYNVEMEYFRPKTK